jgi:uncharacterized protein
LDVLNEYEGAWMTTFTGKKFHFLNPQPDEIDIVDIAHHLSLLCRFTGAVRSFYSVAEHSIRVAQIVPRGLELAALLHDAAEAYINDISRPVKYSHKIEETEKIISRAIGSKFGVDFSDPRIKQADNVLLATEARDLMPNTFGWAELPEPLSKRIYPHNSAFAEGIFLGMFNFYLSEKTSECVFARH